MFDVIQSDLDVLNEGLIGAVSSPVALVNEVGTHLVTAGGKRIRPALCLLAARGSKEFSLERILPLAEALELIHTASLVHDDVIDEADTRRGEPTANAKWDNQIAILGGDYIFARAFSLIAEGGYGDYVAKRLAELVCNLSVGEIIQDHTVYQAVKDLDNYYERIQKKTADFLEICCELGGLVGGLPEEDTKKLAEYGHCIGMAFQITDDVLDIMQTSEQIGKPAGNDIRQGIVTLPVIHALNESADAEELAEIVTNPEMTGEMVERALEIVRMTDGVEVAKAKADEYLERARQVIPADLPAEIKDAFVQVADFIGDRDF
ncbi:MULTISPECIES: polyprenyl synthetase family protein [Selenomonas]|jgi:heptaprenyl diphosphate synthase|uniref:Heptaprenyl diphosphate synthase n=1 Tax=Selenomonas ruminantium TaxID=971 RepID=A0A1K1QVF5_SELRU|nr:MULTISPECIES: polyprenyl synthetase family protein [Selenomonas]SEA33437.1 heptaprenyl diphosphate synthase [Selenomonas ruminantium]SFB14286.1 heptaprenyl diphosphate synthase [Selenomonas ruminantium]SFW63895.1 heptaprenyl diphosphate synthase [Selenomonas ruminantium]